MVRKEQAKGNLTLCKSDEDTLECGLGGQGGGKPK